LQFASIWEHLNEFSSGHFQKSAAGAAEVTDNETAITCNCFYSRASLDKFTLPLYKLYSEPNKKEGEVKICFNLGASEPFFACQLKKNAPLARRTSRD